MTNTREVREVTITRDFQVSPQIVFEDWIYANKFCRWWGPKNFKTSDCKIHAEEGGAMHVYMEAPDGSSHEVRGLYHEVSEPERIVLTTYDLDAEGQPLLEVLHTVTFTGHSEHTHLSITAQVIHAKPEGVKYMATLEQGWEESLDKLEQMTQR